MLTRTLCILAVAALAACTPRGQLSYDADAARVGQVQRIFVGTTRLDDKIGDAFSLQRSFDSRFAKFDISIPPDRELGTLPWPPRRGEPDPRRHMLTVDGTIYDTSAQFRRSLAAELARQKRGEREAVIFVHGFNNTFAEGMYRFAQMKHDMQLPGVGVHYAWPSRASVLGYAYDRDSTLFARDGLEQLIKEVSSAGAERILILAHSMGSHLVMETLRQIAVRNDRATMRRIGGVMLISPDIDVEVFRSQAKTIGELPKPFVIFSSNRDRALRLSAFVSGEANRLGNVNDINDLAGLDVTVLDVSEVSGGNNHFSAGTSPALLRLMASAQDIDGALTRDAQSRVGLFTGAALSVQGATKVILSPVVQIGEQLAE